MFPLLRFRPCIPRMTSPCLTAQGTLTGDCLPDQNGPRSDLLGQGDPASIAELLEEVLGTNTGLWREHALLLDPFLAQKLGSNGKGPRCGRHDLVRAGVNHFARQALPHPFYFDAENR